MVLPSENRGGLLWKITESSTPQDANALPPIDFNPEPSTSVVVFLHPEKASGWMPATESGTMTFLSAAHVKNAFNRCS
jgi:hypothetical protein